MQLANAVANSEIPVNFATFFGIYDANGNIITYESFMANIKKTKAEAKNLKRNSLAKLILYISISASLMLLSYGTYKKYLVQKQNKIENIQQKQR